MARDVGYEASMIPDHWHLDFLYRRPHPAALSSSCQPARQLSIRIFFFVIPESAQAEKDQGHEGHRLIFCSPPPPYTSFLPVCLRQDVDTDFG